MTELGIQGQSAEGVLALAQKIYAEHVSEGQAKHDQLISEASEEATRIRSEAEEEAIQILTDAEKRASELLDEAQRVHHEKTAGAVEYAEQLVKTAESQLTEQTSRIIALQEFESHYRRELQKMVDYATTALSLSEDKEVSNNVDDVQQLDASFEANEIDEDTDLSYAAADDDENDVTVYEIPADIETNVATLQDSLYVDNNDSLYENDVDEVDEGQQSDESDLVDESDDEDNDSENKVENSNFTLSSLTENLYEDDDSVPERTDKD